MGGPKWRDVGSEGIQVWESSHCHITYFHFNGAPQQCGSLENFRCGSKGIGTVIKALSSSESSTDPSSSFL